MKNLAVVVFSFMVKKTGNPMFQNIYKDSLFHMSHKAAKVSVLYIDLF